jgi:hypothetical protein
MTTMTNSSNANNELLNNIIVCMNNIINHYIKDVNDGKLKKKNKFPLVPSKKAVNSKNIYYKPKFNNIQMRYSNLSNRTLRY